MKETVLEMLGICKSFPGVQALDHVDFSVRKGEIHAIVGENGAGKSTLIKVLGGVYAADSGEIKLNGENVHIANPTDSIKKGISIIYQEFNLVPTLSIAENIFLGKEITRGKGCLAALNRPAIFERAQKVMERLHMGSDSIDVTMPLEQLSIAKQQLVEIAKALENNASILVMDEPTAVLTEKETLALFDCIHELTAQGISVIFVSHRLEEVQEISERITILRDGHFIVTLDNTQHQVTKDEIVRYMVGRELVDYYPAAVIKPEEEAILSVRNLSKNGLFHDVSFDLHKGEILGFSGLIGAGRTEMAMTLFGAFQKDSGTIEIEGSPYNGRNIEQAVRAGITLVPEDRKGSGLNLIMSLADNIALPNPKRVSRHGVVSRTKKLKLAEDYIEGLSIRPNLPERAVRDLSGGNQQKVVIAKWLATKPKILILDEPTRGVDVGAKAEIYQLMRNLTAQGIGIIFISSDMPELLGMCDRILVMHNGEISGEFSRENMSQQALMRAAAGLSESDEAEIGE